MPSETDDPLSDCSGLLITDGMALHHACPECGHRAGAHAKQSDGMVSCDVCAVIRAVTDARR
jgi:ribosomal protein L37AE/L43A